MTGEGQGYFTMLSPGKVTVKIYPKYNPGSYNYYGPFNIVINPYPTIASFEVSPSSLALLEGESEQLTVTVKPDTVDKNVTFSSSDTSVATVSSDGVVTAVKAGTAIITVTAADGTHTASCAVTVSTHTHQTSDYHEGTEPTCTEPGTSGYYECIECGRKFSDKEGTKEITDLKIPATGHSFTNYVSDGNATCTQDGTETAKCENCDATDSRTAKGTMVAHSMTENKEVPATCKETGTKAHYQCSECGRKFSDKAGNTEITDLTDLEIPTIDHTWEEIIDWPATEEQTGQKHEECSVCQEKKEAVEIPRLDHTHAMTYHEGSAATCTEAGTKAYYECSKCSKKYSDETGNLEITDLTIPATGHSFTDYVSDNNATCTQDGTKTAKCEKCDATDTITDENSKLPHQWSEWKITKESTCTEKGTKTRTCENCDAAEDEDIAPLGHSLTENKEIPATCTKAGTKAHYQCGRCKKTYSDADGTKEITDLTIPATGHSFTNYVSDNNATCTQDGTKTAKCEKCDATDTITDENSKLPHQWSEWKITKESTCTEKGTKTRTCENCDAAEDEDTAPLGHSLTENKEIPATCTKVGTKAHYQCGRCEKIFSDEAGNLEITDLTIPATGHKWIVEAKWAEDYSSATVTFTCSAGDSKEEKTDVGAVKKIILENGKGKAVYTVTVEHDGETFTDTQTQDVTEKEVEEILEDRSITSTSDYPLEQGYFETEDKGNGSISAESTYGDDVLKTSITNLTTELAWALLDEEEQAEVEAGENILVYMEVTNINNKASEEEKESVESELEKSLGGEVAKDIEYIDLSLFKKIGDDVSPIESTEKSNQSISVNIAIPDDLWDKGHKYYIIRVHDGVPAMLDDVELDAENRTLTFTTDKFSTYAIVSAEVLTPNMEESVTIDKKGGTVQLAVNNPTGQQLIWSSDKESVATVDANGLVTAVGNGTCTITVRAEGMVPVTFTITVKFTTNDGSESNKKDDDPKIVETSDDSTNAQVPKTGDDSNMALWIILLLMFAMAFAGIVVVGKKVACSNEKK